VCNAVRCKSAVFARQDLLPLNENTTRDAMRAARNVEIETRYDSMRRGDPDTQLVAGLWSKGGDLELALITLDAQTGSPDVHSLELCKLFS